MLFSKTRPCCFSGTNSCQPPSSSHGRQKGQATCALAGSTHQTRAQPPALGGDLQRHRVAPCVCIEDFYVAENRASGKQRAMALSLQFLWLRCPLLAEPETSFAKKKWVLQKNRAQFHPPPSIRARFFSGRLGGGNGRKHYKNSDFRKGEADSRPIRRQLARPIRGRFEVDSRSLPEVLFYSVERQRPEERWRSSGLTCSLAPRVLTDCPLSPCKKKALRVSPFCPPSFWFEQVFAAGVVLLQAITFEERGKLVSWKEHAVLPWIVQLFAWS